MWPLAFLWSWFCATVAHLCFVVASAGSHRQENWADLFILGLDVVRFCEPTRYILSLIDLSVIPLFCLYLIRIWCV